MSVDRAKPKNILRRKPKTGYTTLCNEIIEDRRLSYRARGVALLLLSKPDDWEISIPYLVEMGTEGRDAVRKAMHELSDYGYMKRERVQGESGTKVTVTLIADYPAFINDGTPETRRRGYDTDRPTENPTDGKPGSRKTDLLENRPTENQEVILKTEELNTDQPITERESTDTTTTKAAADNNNVGGGGGGLSLVPREIFLTWQATFGELTDEEAALILDDIRERGEAQYLEGLREARRTKVGGKVPIRHPVNYVRSRIPEQRQGEAAQLRPGETETLEERRRYRPEPSPVVPPDDYEPDIPINSEVMAEMLANPSSIGF